MPSVSFPIPKVGCKTERGDEGVRETLTLFAQRASVQSSILHLFRTDSFVSPHPSCEVAARPTAMPYRPALPPPPPHTLIGIPRPPNRLTPVFYISVPLECAKCHKWSHFLISFGRGILDHQCHQLRFQFNQAFPSAALCRG